MQKRWSTGWAAGSFAL
uniref:Uncharacterized protein n=1 Tax=Arundo donax TaxID=35708 RepID=A0A0A9HHE1_ARUDO